LARDLEKQLQVEVRSTTDLKNEISKLHDEFDEHVEENNKLKDKIVCCEEEIRRLKLEKDALHREKEMLIKVNDDIKGKLEVSQKTLK
jgi:chromosome segregation ATPase